MTDFSQSLTIADDIILKGKTVAQGETLAEAGIDPKSARAYGTIARRCRDDKDFGITPYPYEQGPGVLAFSGGFFDHRDWPLRRGMEKHSILRPVVEYEANYVNLAGYWMTFHEAAISLRDEVLGAPDRDSEKANEYDVWALISIRYGLRVVGLRAEFYKMSARDPTYAKMIMPTLEQRHDMAAAHDFQETKEKLDSHLKTQLMKAVATLIASIAT